MQMIATASMRKAVQQSREAQPFAMETIRFLKRFSEYIKHADLHHPLLHEEDIKNVLGVVITSNRGLCGSYHSQLEKKIRSVVNNPAYLITYPLDEATQEQLNREISVNFEWIVVGRKGEKMIRKLDQPIIASFNKLNENVDLAELNAVYRVILDAFQSGKYQKVVIFYTEHVNSLKQVASVGQLLPISLPQVQQVIDDWELNFKDFEAPPEVTADYEVEPGEPEVIETISLLLLKSLLYYFVLESKASVESARMIAMKSASDAALEMQQVLTLTYNQLRQGKITNEIAEISAGRAALE